ncbi:hypothetical protein JCM6882_009468 [Rhodosporidiobolus microsporus]
MSDLSEAQSFFATLLQTMQTVAPHLQRDARRTLKSQAKSLAEQYLSSWPSLNRHTRLLAIRTAVDKIVPAAKTVWASSLPRVSFNASTIAMWTAYDQYLLQIYRRSAEDAPPGSVGAQIDAWKASFRNWVPDPRSCMALQAVAVVATAIEWTTPQRQLPSLGQLHIIYESRTTRSGSILAHSLSHKTSRRAAMYFGGAAATDGGAQW